MVRWMRLGACVLMLAALSGTFGCRVASSDDSADEVASEAASESVESDESAKSSLIEAPTLEEFVLADTKMAVFRLLTYDENGAVLYDQTGTMWVTPDRFRYDLYEGGEFVRSVLTPDGETAYFAEAADEVCTPSVASVANYLAKFNPPPTQAVEDGVDEETGALRMKYDVRETYSIEGAANSWYQEDIVFLIDDNAVVGIITRGYAIDGEGVASAMQMTRRTLTNLQAGVDIEDSVFELPYPVQ